MQYVTARLISQATIITSDIYYIGADMMHPFALSLSNGENTRVSTGSR